MRALVCWLCSLALASSAAQAAGGGEQPGGMRVKDLASVVGLGAHKLIGYGLVVGLEGTGDGRRATFTARAVANMLEQFGISVDGADLRVENAASVMATADVGPEGQVGATLDVLVSSLGDAKSLQGGTLLMTPLLGADGEVCAVGQGPVSIGGFNAGSGGDKVQKNHAVVGRVPAGASVVRELPGELKEVERISLALHVPDFATARRVAQAINAEAGEELAAPRTWSPSWMRWSSSAWSRTPRPRSW
jgi:flagellar P-ring protein precursor FlgI